MFIEEIILDGFKSYAARTVISGWDPEFNAITGLNGSGKSNILDAICFVLGITNLSNVRAHNLQDLVYKRGQAGITKASVTIIFNNADKAQSPVGFEQCNQITVSRQIVIGGKNKFMINGHVAQNQAVANLFQSVQLNINNPHFLIMQGRITKVLNMKPQEILAMIEEAAGTRMFEEKKDKALKTILKKDQKLAEINDLMQNDIAPKLDKLKKEKADFMAFQKIEGEVERLRRFIVAHDYTMTSIRVERSEKTFAQKRERVASLQKDSKTLAKEVDALKDQMNTLLKRKDKEMKKSSKFRELQKEVNELANRLTRISSQYEFKLKAVEEDRVAFEQLQKSKEEGESAIAAASLKQGKMKVDLANAKAELQAANEDAQKQESFLQTLSTGISGSEGQENGFAEQIQAARDAESSAKTDITKAEMRIKFLAEQIQLKSQEVKASEKDTAKFLKEKAQQLSTIAKLQAAVDKLKFDDNEESALSSKQETLQSQISALQDEIDVLTGKLSNLDFQYSDPYKGFDRSKVKGLVAKLVTIDPSKLDRAGALQVCAEGRLFNVVVDDNKVASDILKNGNLKRKYTIIPLKQIKPANIAKEKITKAKELAPGKAEHALELVGYEDDVLPAMKFVFGSTIICKDAASAKKVAYDPAVKMRCITLDGDVYEPGATITGGSRSNSSDVLVKLAHLHDLESKMTAVQKEWMQVSQKLESIQKLVQTRTKAERDLKAAEMELESMNKVAASSSAGILLNEVEKMTSESEELSVKIVALRKRCDDSANRAKVLEKEMKEFGTNKGAKLKKLEKEVAKAKAYAQKEAAKFKKEQHEFIAFGEEFQQLRADLLETERSMEAVQENGLKIKKELAEAKKEMAEIKAEYDFANAELEKQTAVFAQFDTELSRCEGERKQKQAELDEAKLELQKSGHEIEILEQECEESRILLQKISNEHEWIDDQKSHFGKPNTSFDFTAQNPAECRKRLHQLEQEHEALRKKINVKVMNMIDRVVTKERSLKQMIATVGRDKTKIEDTIGQLDQYKREALQRTWTQVNGDFGAIFNELLPGNSAKLEPPEGQQIGEGLEVKVRLGEVWKQSLTELSGGQRSLVALSLILSLLQFKPAPMYILDEIDAALDLSHTQNIGHLFKTRFKGSQFIVVSLKEGMFNNANVLFKARFRDGTSIVERFSANSNINMLAVSNDASTSRKKTTTTSKSRGKPEKKKARATEIEDDDDFENVAAN